MLITKILRIFISVIVLGLLTAMVVLIIGLMRSWDTSTQFSDGFFWGGAILISIGLISFQGYKQRSTEWLSPYLDPAQLSKIGAADTLRGKNLLVVLGISGLLLFGISVLVSLLL